MIGDDSLDVIRRFDVFELFVRRNIDIITTTNLLQKLPNLTTKVLQLLLKQLILAYRLRKFLSVLLSSVGLGITFKDRLRQL